jgi:voltage-gated potassium channel Kch
LRYLADRLLGIGTLAQVALLGAIALVVVTLAVAFLVASGITPDGVHGFDAREALWTSLAHLFDGGTMGNDPADWEFRAVMFVVTVTGLLIVSALIGLLTTGLVNKAEELRRGRSHVIEHDHTLVLGWSPSIFTILSELAIANEGRKRPRVVILADKDKVEMEQEIRSKVADMRGTKVVCRTGLPIDLDDLAIVNPDAARSIIVLASEGGDADTHVLKTILAITNNPNRKADRYHIVAELRDPKKREVAVLVGGDELEIVLSSEVVTRLTVQTCFQSGLSIVYTELFDFAGDEIYLKAEPALVGKTFGEATLAYETCAVIGMRTSDGKVRLNPPMDHVIGPTEQLFAITEDFDHFTLRGTPRIDEAAIRTGERQPRGGPRRTLILAWNRRAPAIIREMDYYVPEGSEVTVVADVPEPAAELSALQPLLQNQAVHFWRGDTTDFTTLDSLDIWSYQHVIVLGYTELLGQQEADARTLVTLLYLRTIAERTGAKVNIVSEMLDIRNRELAKVTKVDDFIVSNNIISLMLAQVSENKHLNAVFLDLLDTQGQEIYLKPAGDYVELGKPVNFYTVVEAARRRGEVAIGHRLMAPEARVGPMDGVSLNPKKSGMTTYQEHDRVIVIAED